MEEQVRHQVRRHGFEFDEISGCGLRTRRTVDSNYADVPYGDVDPCSLVAPAGTWRMPTSGSF
ncbi:MAG: hypothetical protein ACLRM8_07410 [Alistipes sp.]